MNKKIIIIAVVSLFVSVIFTACHTPKDPKARITVLNGFDQNKAAVSAIVTVYVSSSAGGHGQVNPSDGTVKVVGTTDASGVVNFDFSYESILQVKAELPAPLINDTLYGEGVLVLEEDKTYEETVYLRKYKSQL